jgi:hypothetical protein
LTVRNAAANRVSFAIDRVEQVSFEVVRNALDKHLVLRMASSNVAIHHDEQDRVLGVLGIKDLKGEHLGVLGSKDLKTEEKVEEEHD